MGKEPQIPSDCGRVDEVDEVAAVADVALARPSAAAIGLRALQGRRPRKAVWRDRTGRQKEEKPDRIWNGTMGNEVWGGRKIGGYR